MDRWCPACRKAPSGLVPDAHEFCEDCGGPLDFLERAPAGAPEAGPERVVLSCHQCGRKFEASRGSRSFCATCVPEAAPAPQAAAPTDQEPARAAERPLVWAAAWGVALPLSLRVAWAALGGGAAAPEHRLLAALLAFFCAVGFLGVIALARNELGASGSRLEQVVGLLAAAATTAAIVALD